MTVTQFLILKNASSGRYQYERSGRRSCVHLEIIPKGSEIIVEGVIDKPKKSIAYNMRIYVDRIDIVRGKSAESKDTDNDKESDNDYLPF